MTGKMLSKVGASLVRRFGTRDPFQIAKELGISVLLCEDFGSLKGTTSFIGSWHRQTAFMNSCCMT